MVTLIDGDSMIFYGDSMGYSMMNGVFLWLWDLASGKLSQNYMQRSSMLKIGKSTD